MGYRDSAMTNPNPAEAEERIREWCYALGNSESIGDEEVPAYCPSICEHPDCLSMKALLAVLDVDKGRKFNATAAVVLGKLRERQIGVMYKALFPRRGDED